MLLRVKTVAFLVFLALSLHAQQPAPRPQSALVIQGLCQGQVKLNGFWQFHTGDDPRWASPSFDDSRWEPITASDSWGNQGHSGYTGFAWYRTDFDLAAQDVDLTKLNDLLRAYGKFDVAAGKASVYMQMSLKNHYMTGYVKPLFTDLKVYDAQKDKKKPILHQAYELAIGGAAKLLKNRSTKDVATKIDISGPVNTPNVNIWQAIGQFIQNAFVKAIIPGYEHEISLAKAQK